MYGDKGIRSAIQIFRVVFANTESFRNENSHCAATYTVLNTKAQASARTLTMIIILRERAREREREKGAFH
jgi:hypothetical protein